MSDQTSSVRYLPDPPSPRSPFDNTLQLRKDPWPTPHLPNSPPASHDSPDPNPATFQPALTPPASVSMSAQPSHSSVLSASHSPTMPEDGLDNVTSPPHSNVESRSILSQSKSVVSPMKRQSSDDGGGNPPKRPRLEHSDIPSSHTESFEINQNAVDSAAQSSEAPLPTVGISEPDSRSGPGVVSYYKLGSGPIPLSRPHPSENLISLYGLDSIAKTVERKNPVTGEKTNRLRKSYGSKIRDFPGKNQPVSNPEEFTRMMEVPEEEWYAHKVSGNHIPQQFPSETLAKLEKISEVFQPGKLGSEEEKKWKDFFETDDAPDKGAAQQRNTKMNSTSVNPSANQPKKVDNEPIRPTRRGVKRSYHDDSFEGYNEAFEDEAAGEDIFAADSGGKDSRFCPGQEVAKGRKALTRPPGPPRGTGRGRGRGRPRGRRQR